MKKKKFNFKLFLVIWLGILDYLILTKTTINSLLLYALAKPFLFLMNDQELGQIFSGNNFIALVLVNGVVALLFYMSYVNWKARFEKSGKKVKSKFFGL